MEGKRVVVTYGDERLTGDVGKATLEGKIDFPETLESRKVTVGVEYAETAAEYGREGSVAAGSFTLYRKSSALTFNNNTENVTTIFTSRNTLTFTTEKSTDASQIHMEIAPRDIRPRGHKNRMHARFFGCCRVRRGNAEIQR